MFLIELSIFRLGSYCLLRKIFTLCCNFTAALPKITELYQLWSLYKQKTERKVPSKHSSWRRLQRKSFCLPKHLLHVQDVLLKRSLRRPEDALKKTLCKHVLKMSWKMWWHLLANPTWSGLEDVLEDEKLLRLQEMFLLEM